MPLPHEYDKPRLALRAKIIAEIAKHGKNCSLNHLDLTGVANMAALFEDLDFNGDISEWDVSQVRTMQWMFKNTPFNGDVSRWNTRRVSDMSSLFDSCPFTGDISNWNVANAQGKAGMFMNCPFNGDLSKWDMSCTQQVFLMFSNSSFNQPIGMWNMAYATYTSDMFSGGAFNQDIGAWRLPKGSHYRMFMNSQYQGAMPTITLTDQPSDEPVLDRTYRGDFQNKYDLAEARIFGTIKQVDAYLQARLEAGHPLDQLHIEKILTAKRKPTWASKDMHKWVCAEKSVHQGLGLSKTESLTLLNRTYRARCIGQKSPAADSIVFDFISAQ